MFGIYRISVYEWPEATQNKYVNANNSGNKEKIL